LSHRAATWAGWSLYAHEGNLKYHYNFLGMLRFNVTATSPLQSGTPLTRMEFAYDGGGMGKGAAITLYVDGQKAGAEHVKRTRCSFRWTRRWWSAARWKSLFRLTMPCDNAFTGKIKWVQIDIAAAKDADHMIVAEERFNLAMGNQI
jgi:hypothetical protein